MDGVSGMKKLNINIVQKFIVGILVLIVFVTLTVKMNFVSLVLLTGIVIFFLELCRNLMKLSFVYQDNERNHNN